MAEPVLLTYMLKAQYICIDVFHNKPGCRFYFHGNKSCLFSIPSIAAHCTERDKLHGNLHVAIVSKRVQLWKFCSNYLRLQ